LGSNNGQAAYERWAEGLAIDLQLQLFNVFVCSFVTPELQIKFLSLLEQNGLKLWLPAVTHKLWIQD